MLFRSVKNYLDFSNINDVGLYVHLHTERWKRDPILSGLSRAMWRRIETPGLNCLTEKCLLVIRSPRAHVNAGVNRARVWVSTLLEKPEEASSEQADWEGTWRCSSRLQTGLALKEL